MDPIKAISSLPVECNLFSAEENARLEAIYVSTQQKTPHSRSGNDREPKKKVAMMLSYCGTGYYGMQINPTMASIELDLFKALALAGAVSNDNQMQPPKIQFNRCARTDKGVHAGGQLVSFKMILKENVVHLINSYLPPQIRVWGFSAKERCSSRVYEYLLPTYTLQDANVQLYPYSQIGIEAGITDPSGCTRPVLSETDAAQATFKRKAYRVTPEILAHFNEILQNYKGSHNFYNFTVKKLCSDKSALRYMLGLTMSEPMIHNGIEWISIKIHGQSFMLHQIRKMVGLAIMATRTRTHSSIVLNAFKDSRVNIPKAPALGLLLEQPKFEVYNRTVSSKAKDMGPISFEPFEDSIKAFKQEWIYNAIFKEEEVKGEFEDWVTLVDSNSQDYGWFLNPDGGLCLDRIGSVFTRKRKVESESESDAKRVKPLLDGDEDELDQVDDE